MLKCRTLLGFSVARVDGGGIKWNERTRTIPKLRHFNLLPMGVMLKNAKINEFFRGPWSVEAENLSQYSSQLLEYLVMQRHRRSTNAASLW